MKYLLGECGNGVGMKFWETISYEQKINERGKYKGNNPDQHLENIQTFYNIQEDLQSETYTYIPRSIHIDLDPERISIIHNTKYKELFKNTPKITGTHSAGNNYAKGFYTEGAELLDLVLEAVRSELESNYSPQGFQFILWGEGLEVGKELLLLNI